MGGFLFCLIQKSASLVFHNLIYKNMQTTQRNLTQQILLFFLLAGLISACATSRNAANSPVGTWNYLVKNTPYGNVEGQLIISQEDDGYSGELRSSMGNTRLSDISIEGNELKANAWLEGTNLTLAGTVEGDNLQGTIDAGGSGSFPMTASRAN